MSVVNIRDADELIPRIREQSQRFTLPLLGNQFLERYSFYSIKTIVVLFFTYYLRLDANTSTAAYHGFTVLCNVFPLFGAVLADGLWGKYKTIIIFSVIYTIGTISNGLSAVNAVGKWSTHIALASIGLFGIAVGSGGIKPCLVAFGGDQFNPDEESFRSRFFSLFYFVINAGALAAMFLSPFIREKVQCFGGDCYALAFAIPAVLIFLSLILLVLGSPHYRKYPATGDIFLKYSKIVILALKNRWRTPKAQRNEGHWLDYANTRDNNPSIIEIKYLLNVLVLFIPLPAFWALYDQQGSRWTLQAVNMNGYVGNGLKILPDQMQLCNPLMIIILIPIVDNLIYPGLRRTNIECKPLQRMTIGMLLCGLSFIIAALVHKKIDVSLTRVPQLYWQSSLRIINAADCPIVVNSPVYPQWHMGLNNGLQHTLYIYPGEVSETASDFIKPGTYQLRFGCHNSKLTKFQQLSVTLTSLGSFDVIISRKNKTSLKHLFMEHVTKKSDDGRAIVGIVNTLNEDVLVNGDIGVLANNPKALTPLDPGKYSIHVKSYEGSKFVAMKNYSVESGGIYTFVIRGFNSSDMLLGNRFVVIDDFVDVNPNVVSMFWMIPQYFLMTLGEVFLSITGLSFAYSQTDEYYLFSGLMGIATILFMILAYRYVYMEEIVPDMEEDEDD